MTISGTYTQTVSLAFSFSSASGATAAEPAQPQAPDAPSAPQADHVDISSRADALMQALDKDGDGVITGQEFTDGAEGLLRRAGAAQRHHRHHDEHDTDSHGGHHGVDSRGSHRFEQRLQNAFNRIDANGDGAVDKGELASALAGAQSGGDTQAPSDAAPQTASSVTQMTVVAIAVRQYTVTAQSDGGSAASNFSAAA